jgi:hypothetical protein
MTRNLKALGLALVAVFAMSAMAASAAQAEGVSELTPANNQHVIITGEQIGKMSILFATGLEMTCESVKFDSTITGNSTTLTETPTYSGCHSALGSITITMNGCDYLIHGQLTNGGAYPVSTDIVCPTVEGVEKTIELHIYGDAGHTTLNCTLTIKGQTGKTTTTITNVAGTPDDIKLETHLASIEMTSHQGACGKKTQWESLALNGSVTMKAYTTIGTPETENSQVNLTVSHL